MLGPEGSRNRTAAWGGRVASAACLAALIIGSGGSDVARSARQAATAQENAGGGDEGGDNGVYLPTDRLTERRLEIARRLVADARWSDAATLLDEILASDRDSFFKRDVDAATWQSVKAEAASLIAGLPQSGREAYLLQFRARAERLVAEGIANGDGQAVAMVARRWPSTPAGQRATMLAALAALEDGQALAAAAWLDRLHAANAADFEPTLSVMRAVAWQRAGNPQAAAAILDAARAGKGTSVRIAGRDVTMSFAAGRGLEWLAGHVGEPPQSAGRAAVEWRMHRGDAARNAVVDASRPLLVPRYRVPLTRHPEEGRWLESRRRLAADREAPLLPAAMPLAVNGTVVLHTPMGLLAVDFETGKRLWLQTGGAAAPVTDAGGAMADGEEPIVAGEVVHHRALAPVFDDATSGSLASDGRLVFAVESHPDALASRDGGDPQMRIPGQIRMLGAGNGSPGGWNGGNVLAAYDLSDRGRLRWRLPTAEAARDVALAAWKLGPPLPIGDRLFLLLEERGEVRLDVLDASTGSAIWSQPLAELDEEKRVDNRDNQPRRVAGLTPALAEGVLVCPTGAGAVVAVDLATRTLLWAYDYPTAAAEDADVVVLRNGVRMARPGRPNGGPMVIQAESGRGSRWIETGPVLAAGRAILTPAESNELHCLDLRSGRVAWRRPRKEGLYVAGVSGDCILVVGQRGVEAVSIATGEPMWFTPLTADGATISGRGLLTADRLFVPVDTPEVVELELARGTVVGRSAGRGGAVPGNLVAYRGEVLSQGVDSLDVFHQTEPLEARIETAANERPAEEDDAWRLMWRGQLKLDRGAVAEGIADLRRSQSVAPDRFPQDVLAEAMIFAMERDPGVIPAMWSDLPSSQVAQPILHRGLRVVIDGLIEANDHAAAWKACRHLLELPAAGLSDTEGEFLVSDGKDPQLAMTEARWIQSRIADLYARGPADVRGEIDAFAAATLASIRAAADRLSSVDAAADAIEAFIERFGRHAAAVEARRELMGRLDRMIAASGADGDAARSPTIRRDFAMIDLLHTGTPEDRRRAEAAVAAARADLGSVSPALVAEAWPVGRVAVTRAAGGTGRDGRGHRATRLLPLPVEADDALLRGVRIDFDMQQGGLVVSDSLGRRLGSSIQLQEQRPFFGGGLHGGMSAVTMIGRVAVLRSEGFVMAYELAGLEPAAGGRGHRRLWVRDSPGPARHPGFARAVNTRFPRSGSVPLGMPIPEPEGAIVAVPADIPARVTGVPMLAPGAVQVLDPVTGAVLWERRRLPEAAVVFGDDDVLCICPGGGREAVVLSMATGRLIRTCDLPGREERLLTHGRHLVTVTRRTPAPGRAVAETVEMEVIDPVEMSRTLLGQFSGESRATLCDGELFILEPSGTLTVFGLADRRVVFTSQLPEMPERLERLEVMRWHDRSIVIAGRAETDAERRHLERVGTVGPLPQLAAGGPPLTGSIWAVDRADGRMLWPAPATIFHHCLHLGQPPDLPFLLFARQIETRRGGERPRLSVLCLDKRTGQALHVDDTILAQPHLLFSCEAVGDPARHTISVMPVGAGTAWIELTFTGERQPPPQPFQAASRPLVAGDMATELEYWWHRLITLPFPF